MQIDSINIIKTSLFTGLKFILISSKKPITNKLKDIMKKTKIKISKK